MCFASDALSSLHTDHDLTDTKRARKHHPILEVGRRVGQHPPGVFLVPPARSIRRHQPMDLGHVSKVQVGTRMSYQSAALTLLLRDSPKPFSPISMAMEESTHSMGRTRWTGSCVLGSPGGIWTALASQVLELPLSRPPFCFVLALEDCSHGGFLPEIILRLPCFLLTACSTLGNATSVLQVRPN